jgi:hypothetical protein
MGILTHDKPRIEMYVAFKKHIDSVGGTGESTERSRSL